MKILKEEFQALWDKINLKTIYEVQFDTQHLIDDSTKIDVALFDRSYEVKTGELKDGTAEQMKEGSLLDGAKSKHLKLNNDLYSNTVYDIIGEIEELTNLTRKTIVEILKKIKEEKFLLIRKNPEEFIGRCSKLINEVKASLIINNIVYHKTEERMMLKLYLPMISLPCVSLSYSKKHILIFLTSDSRLSQTFATALEKNFEIVVYASFLSFYVSTPVANYSPDWAIVFDKDKVRHIYFVAETKGSDSDMDLREIEKLKNPLCHC